MIAGTRPQVRTATPLVASTNLLTVSSEKSTAELAVAPHIVSYVIPIVRPPAASGEMLHASVQSNASVTPQALPDVATTELAQPKRLRTLRMQVTAYCACSKCCGPNARGVTASGRSVSYNSGAFVAADTSVLPFGTKLQIPGYHNDQPVEVIDRGGAIKGRHIDLFFATHQQALEWGRQWLTVTVME
jgi:3D (Asp-Asp-Asp) domain-containing protein